MESAWFRGVHHQLFGLRIMISWSSASKSVPCLVHFHDDSRGCKTFQAVQRSSFPAAPLTNLLLLPAAATTPCPRPCWTETFCLAPPKSNILEFAVPDTMLHGTYRETTLDSRGKWMAWSVNDGVSSPSQSECMFSESGSM